MAEPNWLAGGNTPHLSDSRWFRWARIAGRAYDLWGTNILHKPKPTDSVDDFKKKFNRITDDEAP